MGLRPPLLVFEMASLVRNSLQLHHVVSYVSLYLKQSVEAKAAKHLAKQKGHKGSGTYLWLPSREDISNIQPYYHVGTS